jgi:hypothetical protein
MDDTELLMIILHPYNKTVALAVNPYVKRSSSKPKGSNIQIFSKKKATKEKQSTSFSCLDTNM